jgi:phage gpG-like protein
MVQIIVQTEGFEKAYEVFNELEGPEWRAKLLNLIGLTVTAQSINHFSEQGGPHGPWEPTQRGGMMLVLTGALRGSITHAVLSDDEVAIGTDIFYGVFHQFGTIKMPRREFLGFTDSDKDELSNVIDTYIHGLM